MFSISYISACPCGLTKVKESPLIDQNQLLSAIIMKFIKSEYLSQVIDKESDFFIEKIWILLIESKSIFPLLLARVFHFAPYFIKTVEIYSQFLEVIKMYIFAYLCFLYKFGANQSSHFIFLRLSQLLLHFT